MLLQFLSSPVRFPQYRYPVPNPESTYRHGLECPDVVQVVSPFIHLLYFPLPTIFSSALPFWYTCFHPLLFYEVIPRYFPLTYHLRVRVYRKTVFVYVFMRVSFSFLARFLIGLGTYGGRWRLFVFASKWRKLIFFALVMLALLRLLIYLCV